MKDLRTPVLVGAGQVVQKDVELEEAKGPLELMAEACRLAAADAGGGRSLLEAVDTLAVVNILCWDYGDAPRLLAETLEIQPRRRIASSVGGNTPQALLSAMADRIAAGEADVVLLAGAEAFHTGRSARRMGRDLGWPRVRGSKPDVFGDERLGLSDIESRHGLHRPTEIYPLFETAIRAHEGRGHEEHARIIGELYAPFSDVAAANPYAWFRRSRSPQEIATPGASNRYVGFPYTKLMNAIIMVDQGAALFLTSLEAARRLGLDEQRWVFPVGGAEANDHWFVSERPELHRSPAVRAATEAALEMAGVEASALSYVDLYSCFPCAVQIARDELDLNGDRPLTLTGGLAYHGGPGNNYAMHSVAEAVRRLRHDRDAYALTTALGWFMTKHAAGVYSGTPPRKPWRRADPERPQRVADEAARIEPVEEAEGEARIETYTVMHDREQVPTQVIVFGRLADDRRFVANAAPEPEVVRALVEGDGVGLRGRVRCENRVHTFVPS